MSVVGIVKGIEELVAEFDEGSAGGFMGVMVAVLYAASVYALEKFGTGIWFNPGIRGFVADYAYPVCCPS